ncbi:hypothetical protein TrVE_jg4200 [Triparma verrucosa]|uniref:Uncharacterized protein n=1 Tax=Triparma verrucosa TaxID=1606542 RepID=A0A9W7EZY0_9STRA|nr:hypothetical protein TrVE_jg4200 [Triparma verrucosa]
MQLTPPRSSPLAMLPTGPDPNIFQSMKKQYGDYLLPDEVYARGNANSPKEYHYKSRTKDQLRDGFGESFRGVNEGEEVEEVNPPMAIYRNNVDAIRTLKRKKRRKVVKRSGQAWEVPEDTVEADAADLLYAGSENRSEKVVRQRPQSAKPKLSGSGGRPNQQQRKVRPQSAQSPSKKARPGSARPKSALPLHQAKNRKARPASARPSKTFRPTSAPINPVNKVNKHFHTLHILENETAKLFNSLNIAAGGIPLRGGGGRSLRRTRRKKTVKRNNFTDTVGEEVEILKMTEFRATTTGALSPVGASPTQGSTPILVDSPIVPRSASPLLSQSELEQDPHRWIGSNVVVIGPWSDLMGSFAGDVVGYTARDDLYVITCAELFNHPDSLPIEPTAPTAPEVGDAIRVDKKTMIRGVALARIRSRGERMVLARHGPDEVADQAVEGEELQVEVEIPLKMPDLAKTVPEVDTVTASVPSEAPIYEEDDFEEAEVREEDGVEEREREEEPTNAAYDEDDFEEMSEPSKNLQPAKPYNNNNEYSDSDFESEGASVNPPPDFRPTVTKDDLITTQKILAKSMLRPAGTQDIGNSAERNPRVPLHTLNETATSLLLAYLGFARYSHLLLSSGVTGMDLVSSTDEDLECLGIGFRPHRQRLLKAVKATRHAGVDMGKLGLLGELEDAVNAAPPVFLDVMTFHKRRSPSPSSPLSWDFQIRAEQDARYAACITIQTKWRSYSIRKRYRKRMHIKLEAEQEVEGALKIQCLFRRRTAVRKRKNMWYHKKLEEERNDAARAIQSFFRMIRDQGRARRRKKTVLLQRELKARVAKLEEALAKEEEERYLAEEKLEQEKEAAAEALRKEKREAEARVRAQTRLANEALSKLREMEQVRASENRMLAEFRKKEKERVEEVERLKQEKLAATQMQRLMRGKSSRKKVTELKARRDEAAVTITYALRLAASMRKVRAKRTEVAEFNEQMNAATLLQCTTRRRNAKNELKKRQEAKKLKELEEAERWVQGEAAVLLQRQMRGKQARVRVDELRSERLLEAGRALENSALNNLLVGAAEDEEEKKVGRKGSALAETLFAAAEKDTEEEMSVQSSVLAGALFAAADDEADAALLLQGRARIHLAKKEAAAKREELSLQQVLEREYELEMERVAEEERREEEREQEDAAVRLQGRVRIRSAKKRVGEKRREIEEEMTYEKEQQEEAAVRLQGRVRIRSAKKRVGEKRREIEDEEEKLLEEEKDVVNEDIESTSTVSGWISVIDPDSRLVYYYNHETFESSWEMPEICKGVDMELWRKAEDGGWVLADDPVGTPSKYYPKSPQHSSPMRTPAKTPKEEGEWKLRRTASKVVMKEKEWVEYFDEKRGMPFYYNIITGDSTWAKPDGIEGVKSVREEIEGEGEGGAGGGGEDWMDGIDAEEVEEEEEEGGEEGGGEKKGEEDWQLKRQKSVREVVTTSGWSKYKDPSTNATFYFNERSGESRWEPPEEFASPTAGGDDEWEVKRTSSVRKKGVGDWVQYEDPSNGDAPFWHNIKTGESSWERPDDFESDDEGDDGGGGGGGGGGDDQMQGLEQFLNQVATNVDTPMTEEKKDPAEDWETHLDAESKRVYYFNKVTQMSTWDKPPELVEKEGLNVVKSLGQELDDESGDELENSLVGGWKEFTDKASGRKYFFNPTTKESRWDSLEGGRESGEGGGGVKGGGGGGGGHETPARNRLARASFEGRRGSVGAQPVFSIQQKRGSSGGAGGGGGGGDGDMSLASSDSSYSLGMGMGDYGKMG